MKPRSLCAAILLSACGGVFVSDWKAGAARAVITPTEPMYLAGFASREVPAEGTAMDLHAKALAIEDTHGTRFVTTQPKNVGFAKITTCTMEIIGLGVLRASRTPYSRTTDCSGQE